MSKSMEVLSRIASALGQRDQAPNLALAREIAETKDKKAVNELVEGLMNKDKAIQNDCIKVLYEIGEIEPFLLVDYLDSFLALLHSKNNRLQWGSMTALNCIVKVKPKEIYDHLPTIMEATEKGSVITRDNAVNVLINLASHPSYSEDAFPLLIEQLLKSPTNQLPMYAERMLPIVTPENKDDFVTALNSRLDEIEKESKKKRVEKVIKKIK